MEWNGMERKGKGKKGDSSLNLGRKLVKLDRGEAKRARDKELRAGNKESYFNV